MSALDKESRPRAYEKNSYLWYFQDIPAELIDLDGNKIKNPIRDAAVFVVHGMGEQAHLDTTAMLRDKFGDVISDLQKAHNKFDIKIPAPFTFEGFWANYDDVEKTFPNKWESFNEREKSFLQKFGKEKFNPVDENLFSKWDTSFIMVSERKRYCFRRKKQS